MRTHRVAPDDTVAAQERFSRTNAHASSAELNGIEVMLQGGQMGPPDLLRRLQDGG